MKRERGFALLIVFLMSAAIAVMLYRQIPRVAFESERDKEQLLIERGEQYKRAIQLYFVAFKKYPSKIEDLENTNQQRFLRHRFVDPMTGKKEWRLIHVNGAGMLTDSLVQKPPGDAQLAGASTPSGPSNPANPASIAASLAAPPAGTTPAAGADSQPQVNAAVLPRPSDRPLVPASGAGNIGAASTDPNDPRNWPPIFLQVTGQNGAQLPGARGQVGANPVQGLAPQNPGQFPGQAFPGQPFPGQPAIGSQFPNAAGQSFPGQPGGTIQPTSTQPIVPQQTGLFQNSGGFPGQSGIGANPTGQPFSPGGLPGQGFRGQNFPGQNFAGQNFPGQPGGSQPPQFPGQAPGGMPPGFAPTGFTPGPVNAGGGQSGAPNPALDAINNLLRTPRQPPNAAGTNNPLNTGGLAGVASTYEGPSIKVYKERSKYNEWEFIFDLKQGIPGQPPNGQRPAQASPNPLGPATGPGPGAGPGAPSGGLLGPPAGLGATNPPQPQQ